MERGIEKALRSRISVEWDYQPDKADVQKTYDELFSVITAELTKGSTVAFIKLSDNNIPNTISSYSIEPGTNKIDQRQAAIAAEQLLVRHAKQYQDPLVELAIVDRRSIRFPLRPDLKPVKIKAD